MALRIAIDNRLETARLTYPFEAGWVEQGGVSLVAGLTSTRAAEVDIALLDSVSALSMLANFAVLSDLALVARRATMLTLATHTRPDDVDDVAVSLAGVSPAGRAVALATLQPFYGIRAREWSEETFPVDTEHAVVSEGPAALILAGDEETHQEDLGRAWYLLTDTPFVSHICVVRRGLLSRDPVAVAEAAGHLVASLEAGNERGRELRRDMAKRYDIDRDLLVEVMADQEWELTAEGVSGLALLARRSGLTSGPALERAVVRVRTSKAG
ncbi:MAG TPA: hypothetical protein PLR44_11230 [Thermomicrobiales bacterium]|nr:hypothetical protein [Thermomicrobiales bacterium]